MIINGRSQHERINRGVDNGSVAINLFIEYQPVSEVHFTHDRLNRAIMKLWVRADGQSHLCGTNQVVGINMIVGIKITNIVRYLVLIFDQCHEFERWLLEVQGQ